MQEMLSQQQVNAFRKKIWCWYARNKRMFPWRNTRNPYHIFISEVMLQQTQTIRVAKKYAPFIRSFPTWTALSQATLQEVLSCWIGLGYNRRARFLLQSARIVCEKYKKTLPKNSQILKTFPGIGDATAASIATFAFNNVTFFIETNIRTVFIDTFFHNCKKISDKQIIPYVAQTVDRKNPRDWYYALTDYGVFLKKEKKNPSRISAHYKKQSPFLGSDRQIRGKIIALLTSQTTGIEKQTIYAKIDADQKRIDRILLTLKKEKMVQDHKETPKKTFFSIL